MLAFQGLSRLSDFEPPTNRVVTTGLLALWMCNKLVHDPDYLRAEQLAMRKRKAPFAWPLPAEPDNDLLGNRAEQRPGVGLDRRPILPCADPAGFVRARSLRTGLARAAYQESAHQFPHPGRPELSLVVRHYLLRVRRALRKHDYSARPAAIALRLRRHH